MGETWQLVPDNFPDSEIFSVAITPTESTIATVKASSLWQTTTTVSTINLNPNQLLQIWPNPTEKGTVTVHTGIIQPLMINIYNLQGQILLSQSTNSRETLIDISTFKAGVYIVKFNEKSLKLVVR